LASAFLLHAIPLTFVSESGIYLAILFYLFIFLTSRDLKNGISVQFWSRKSGFEKKKDDLNFSSYMSAKCAQCLRPQHTHFFVSLFCVIRIFSHHIFSHTHFFVSHLFVYAFVRTRIFSYLIVCIALTFAYEEIQYGKMHVRMNAMRTNATRKFVLGP